ncbi:hypothetical protein PsorP6_007411 [Peronosclerospora sorghi]|uniref:Uncharacterized protein n=1 Tax=Peronosclerospora sorghi TaxID=230839 RepID=A0ACC0W7F2_9STRA|nr:hypothetical protein PsorP6_007411 [Peronosclerospora sorghi]
MTRLEGTEAHHENAESINAQRVVQGWKFDIKAQVQNIQKKIRQQDTQAVEDARVFLDQSAARYRVVVQAHLAQLWHLTSLSSARFLNRSNASSRAMTVTCSTQT